MKYPELKWVVLRMWQHTSSWEPVAAFATELAAQSFVDACESVDCEFMTHKIEEISYEQN